MNVIKNDTAQNAPRGGMRFGRGRGRDYQYFSNTKVRERPITSIQPKYSVHESGKTAKTSTATSASTVFKTPSVPPSKRTVTTSSSSNAARSSGTSRTEISAQSHVNQSDSCVIIALTTGRGESACEVGMAVMDLKNPHLIMSQISDTETFIHTMANINLFQPVEILMPEKLCSADSVKCKLFATIRENFKDLEITAIERHHFNDADGFDRVKTLVADEYSSIVFFVNQKYFALAATAALFKYIENIQRIIHAPKSLKIHFQVTQEKMLIDVDTANNLELVTCLNPRVNYYSLLAAINRCGTPVGRRLLRASILQPPCDPAVIETRQSCIAELLSNRPMHSLLMMILKRLGGIGKLVHGLCVKTLDTNGEDNAKIAERKLNYILLLKHTLEILPEVESILETSISPFFRKVLENLGDGRFAKMLKQIKTLLHDDARSVSGFSSANMQRCFAIRPNVSDVIDVARQTYIELIDSMDELVRNYCDRYRLPLTLNCTAFMGYHIRMAVPKRVNFRLTELPRELINVTKKQNTLYMTTSRLISLSDSCNDVSEELQTMSALLLEGLTRDLRESIGCLYNLSADIAELDMIVSLARISSMPDFVEPTFGPNFRVQESRHPIKYILEDELMIPNSIDISDDKNLQIITSPNKSGKTTYLMQIALMQILAQIGCRVPAARAEFRITDRLFSLIVPRDDMECQASTFVVEMKKLLHILYNCSEKSLIILDEPCSSTNAEEGMSIAWAILERLASTKAFTIVATHYMFLTQLADSYINIINLNLECVYKDEDECKLMFAYKINPGPTKISHYGLSLARIMALDEKTLKHAESIAEKLSKDIRKETPKTREELIEEKCFEYTNELVELINTNKFDFYSVRNIANKIYNDPLMKDLGDEEPVEKATDQSIPKTDNVGVEENQEDTPVSPVIPKRIREQVKKKIPGSKLNFSALKAFNKESGKESAKLPDSPSSSQQVSLASSITKPTPPSQNKQTKKKVAMLDLSHYGFTRKESTAQSQLARVSQPLGCITQSQILSHFSSGRASFKNLFQRKTPSPMIGGITSMSLTRRSSMISESKSYLTAVGSPVGTLSTTSSRNRDDTTRTNISVVANCSAFSDSSRENSFTSLTTNVSNITDALVDRAKMFTPISDSQLDSSNDGSRVYKKIFGIDSTQEVVTPSPIRQRFSSSASTVVVQIDPRIQQGLVLESTSNASSAKTDSSFSYRNMLPQSDNKYLCPDLGSAIFGREVNRSCITITSDENSRRSSFTPPPSKKSKVPDPVNVGKETLKKEARIFKEIEGSNFDEEEFCKSPQREEDVENDESVCECTQSFGSITVYEDSE